MTHALTTEATSKLGSVAIVRGDASQLLALTTIPDRITRTQKEHHVTTKTPAPEVPDLDHPVTAQQIGELYGLTPGAVQTNRVETGIVKVGSRMRHYLYDHASVVRAFRDGKLGRPRAGGKGNRDAEWVAECRARIETAIDALNVRETVERAEAAMLAEARTPRAMNGNGSAPVEPAREPEPQPAAPVLPDAPPSAVAALQSLARLEGMASMLTNERERHAILLAIDDLRCRIGEL